jgi:hypothetical protein
VKRRKKVSGEQTIIPKLCLIPTYVPYKGILLDKTFTKCDIAESKENK